MFCRLSLGNDICSQFIYGVIQNATEILSLDHVTFTYFEISHERLGLNKDVA